MADAAKSTLYVLTGTAADALTAPAAHTYHVQCITFTNTDTSIRTVTLSKGADATGASGTRIFSALPIDPNETLVINGYWPLAATEKFQAFCDTASKANVTFGYVDES